MITDSQSSGQAILEQASLGNWSSPMLPELDVAIAELRLAIDLSDCTELDSMMADLYLLYRRRLTLRGAA